MNPELIELGCCPRCYKELTDTEIEERNSLMWYEDNGSEYCDKCLDIMARETAYFENLESELE